MSSRGTWYPGGFCAAELDIIVDIDGKVYVITL
ncbi:putative lipoprotein, partial [Trichinella spiralis]